MLGSSQQSLSNLNFTVTILKDAQEKKQTEQEVKGWEIFMSVVSTPVSLCLLDGGRCKDPFN